MRHARQVCRISFDQNHHQRGINVRRDEYFRWFVSFREKITLNVLLLEDSSSEARLILEMLPPHNGSPIQVEWVKLLADAMQHLAQSDFDAVLMDLTLPDSDGLGTLKCLLDAHPTIPVVVLTGMDDDRLALEALRCGAQDYVLKTELHKGTLARALRYAVERNRTNSLKATNETMRARTLGYAVERKRRSQAEEQLLYVQEEERRRVARGLHDGVLQSLFALRLRLQLLADRNADRHGDLSTQLHALADKTLATIEEARRIARDLYPIVLEKKWLGEAIRSYAGQLQAESGMEFDIQVDCPRPLPLFIKQHLFRIFQECARNVIRHAGATQVRITLRADHEQVALEIVDNGQGFDVAAVESSSERLGLVSIRERAQLLGGDASIESDIGQGASVLVHVPIVNATAVEQA